mgnify:CR=1 FL=1
MDFEVREPSTSSAQRVGGELDDGPDLPGLFSVALDTKSGSTVEGIEALYEEIDAMVAAPPSADEAPRRRLLQVVAADADAAAARAASRRVDGASVATRIRRAPTLSAKWVSSARISLGSLPRVSTTNA